MPRHFLVVLPVLFSLAAPLGSAQEAERKGKASPSPRPPWTTSRVKGTPDPPAPYAAAVAFKNLKFLRPVAITTAPGLARWFVVELDGKIHSFPNDPACAKLDLFADLKAREPLLSQAYGIAFHPDFPANRQVFLAYVLQGDKPDGTRVSRFRVREGDPPAIEPDSEEILLTFLGGGHNGACLKFGPDGKLYISTGDGTGPSPPDVLDTGQDCSDLLSSILRIDVDRRDPGLGYAVPRDNPFVDVPGVRPEIWAFGFRNPWQMSFDRQRGELWVGDVGWDQWELVYRVRRGGNYGWSIVEGRQPVRPTARRGPAPILPPTIDHAHHEARSITGGYVYRGNANPDLSGCYVYGDFATGKIWAAKVEADSVGPPRELVDTPLQVVCFGEDAAGELVFLDYETTGRIYRLVSNPRKDSSASFPRLLSQTGLFDDIRGMRPATGVVPYGIAAEPWADGAAAERLLALPGDARLSFDEQGRCAFPEGTVIAKTIRLAKSSPRGGGRRVETQLLHLEDKEWRPYAYAWDDEETDATLVGAAGTVVPLGRGDSGRAGGEYRIVSRAECGICHAAALGSVLGATAAQLDRAIDLGEGPENQLAAWRKRGMIDRPIDKRPSALVDPRDSSQPLERRARSYLHANCQHCHRIQGAGTATINLEYAVPLDATLTVGAPPAQGDMGMPGARIIEPGNPYRSVLFLRVLKEGRGRMPHLGSSEVDEAGVRLLEEWIRGLAPADSAAARSARTLDERASVAAGECGQSTASECGSECSRLLDTVPGAIALCLRLSNAPASLRGQIAEVASRRPDPIVRDLFERYLPPERRIARLGDRIDPEMVLGLTGDAERGRRAFFFAGGLRCKTCHQIDGAGGLAGPDLSRIGTRLSRAQILDSLLFPSKAIEPKYQVHAIATTTGEVHTGIVVERTATMLSIRDAQDRRIDLSLGDVESIMPLPQSLMPEGLLRDLTAQEAADLVDFLWAQR